jgi:hypothetical protein
VKSLHGLGAGRGKKRFYGATKGLAFVALRILMGAVSLAQRFASIKGGLLRNE